MTSAGAVAPDMFMRVARSLAVQESRALRGYARAGLPIVARSHVFDDALEMGEAGGRRVRQHWAGVLPVRGPSPEAVA